MKNILSLLMVFLFSCSVVSQNVRVENDYKKKAYKSVGMIFTRTIRGTVMSGTIFAVDKKRLVTAGHVCEGILEELKIQPNNAVMMVVVNNNEQHLVLQLDSKEVAKSKIDKVHDLCVMNAERHGLIPVNLSKNFEPEIRQKVFILGAPSSVFPVETEGVISLPSFSFYAPEDKVLLSASIFSGNSGSPVWGENGSVIGIIVSGDNTYTGIAYMVSVRYLNKFLENKLDNVK